MAVTAVAPKYQCAEMTRIARGLGTCWAMSRHASVKPLRSRVFMGLPWPMKNAGILVITHRSDLASPQSVRQPFQVRQPEGQFRRKGQGIDAHLAPPMRHRSSSEAIAAPRGGALLELRRNGVRSASRG